MKFHHAIGTSALRRAVLGASLLAFSGCGGAATPESTTAEEALPPAPTFTNRIALRGPDGARVNVAEFGNDAAYLEVSGVRSPMADLVLQATVVDQNGRLQYQVTRKGLDIYPLHREARSGETSWTLYTLDSRDPVRLEYDEEASPLVDAQALHARHLAQTRDGRIAAFQDFNRDEWVAATEEELNRPRERFGEECESSVMMSVNWDSIDDSVYGEYSISGHCETILDALRNICRLEYGKRFVRDQVQNIVCSWNGAEEWDLQFSEGTLALQAAHTSNLQQKIGERLRELPYDSQMSVGQAVEYARTDVCRSENGENLIVVHPDSGAGISYGTPERLFHSPQNAMITSGAFFDPRHFVADRSANFRGQDYRYYSMVEVDHDANTCSLTCGTRESNWTLVPLEEATALLRGAATERSPFDRIPHALARDQRGIYYYVDRGRTEETAGEFRVYRGRRGNLRPLEMRDVAADSEGEVFSTSQGDLRLIVDQDEPSHWIERGRQMDLRRVPVNENYQLIFNELGVYTADRLETPCDDY